jgi:HK97 gp10 family phage protein
MPTEIEVEVQGLLEIQKKMDKIVLDLHGPSLLNAMRDATLLVVRDARINAPVDTGRLRASIVPSVKALGKNVEGVVGSNVKYAPYQEFGTGTFVGKAPHRPPSHALERWAHLHKLPKGYGFVIARAIGRRGGLEPQRYLRDAFDKNETRIKTMIGDAVARIITK